MEKDLKARLLAYYLPQFHPIPENDLWWGKGFTEWTNTAKAKPLFRGHYQPHVPADLGYYDLRLPESREAQADLAAEHGIEGFCYWHYWFGGKRILEGPFNEVLKSGKPDFPFCLGWANESWTGIWHGAGDQMLLEQVYPGKEDEVAHFQFALKAFSDPRYITVDGKPLFHVYKPHLLPNARAFTDHWRELAHKAGLPGLYFIGEDWTPNWDPIADGFDASLRHNPGIALYLLKSKQLKQLSLKIYEKMPWLFSHAYSFRYEDFVKAALSVVDLKSSTQIPTVLPNWDNTPRSGSRGHVLVGSTPELFRNYLKTIVDGIAWKEKEHRIVIVKSWNEWAEGNHLEPDLQFGKAYLEACKSVVIGD
jgi:lipopolysaccharide biosynthesis protein